MINRFIVFVICVEATLVFASNGSHESVKKAAHKTFTEIVAEHPMPNLDDLAERSKPNVHDPNISKPSFYDLLKLRTAGTPEAIPALEQVIKDNLYDTRIHGFAAAQALFCIDTPQAHAILKQYIFDDRYNTRLGIGYAFHWEMAEPQRSAFIEQYHINNRSETLQIDLAAKSETLNNVQTIMILATLKNISDEPCRIYNYPFAFGDHLYFRRQNGHFIQKMQTCTRCFATDEWLELKPGETKQYQTKIEVAIADQSVESFCRYLKNGNLWLKEDHSNAFFIENPGAFQIYAMLENAPLSKERKKQLGFENAWVGRAVSKPVTIIIRPVK